jgi:hypothetical protein
MTLFTRVSNYWSLMLDSLHQGKSSSQLVDMREQIRARIVSGDAVDVGYWETLLSYLSAFLSKARLREKHQRLLEIKLQSLRRDYMQRQSNTASTAYSPTPTTFVDTTAPE